MSWVQCWVTNELGEILGNRTASGDIKSDPKLVVTLVVLALVVVLVVVGGLPDEKTDIYLWPKTWS